ncbi:GlxA family transcriptional regulator [Pseudomonas nitroreducens]|uniref:GlxA family transcriptional regulator n=1 Tax=Pseudomonas nitroreducens TaxID=46680 RepID=UPI00351D9025
MFRIALFVCPQTLCSSLGLAMDAFHLANRLAGRRLFEVLRVSADGMPVALSFGHIEVEGGLDLASDCSLLLIPATGPDVAATCRANQPLLAWLRAAPTGVELGSLCSSAFLLAEAGVLDGRRATTHWALEAAFRERYPQVNLDIDALCTEDGGRLCSGGAQAGLDLCLYLIERHAGAALARRAAATLVFEHGRGRQRRFTPLLPEPVPEGSALAPLLEWLEDNYAEPFDLAALAQRAHCSTRTLLRRFREQLGMTPNDYVQRLRIASAQEALGDPGRSLERIASDIGYADRASFARLFKQLCGETPGAFRQRLLGRSA